MQREFNDLLFRAQWPSCQPPCTKCRKQHDYFIPKLEGVFLIEKKNLKYILKHKMFYLKDQRFNGILFSAPCYLSCHFSVILAVVCVCFQPGFSLFLTIRLCLKLIILPAFQNVRFSMATEMQMKISGIAMGK